jgi:hypothetical protein
MKIFWGGCRARPKNTTYLRDSLTYQPLQDLPISLFSSPLRPQRSLRFIKKNIKNEIKLLYFQLNTLSPNSHSELAANLALAN